MNALSKLAIAATLLLQFGLCASAQNGPRPLSENFAFTSGDMKCVVLADGSLRDVSFAGQPVVSSIILHGSYAKEAGDKTDNRFFQGLGADAPATVEVANGVCTVKRAATLSNEKNPKGASYSETIRISAEAIELETELSTLVPFSANANVFLNIIDMPVDYAGKGFSATKTDGANLRAIIPQVYAKDSNQHFFCSNADFSLKGVLVSFSAGDDSTLCFMDKRSWGEKEFRIDAMQTTAWHEQPCAIPAGTKCKWAFKISASKI